MKQFFLVAIIVFLAGCTTLPETDVKPSLTPVSFDKITGWNDDNVANALPAFLKSCAKKNTALEKSCAAAEQLDLHDAQAVRHFWQTYFTPHKIRVGHEDHGLFTGYYEPQLYGSLVREGVYQTPLRARPDDLVMVHLGQFRDDLAGRRIAGRVMNGTLKPYEDHAAINAGTLPKSQDNPIVWVDDPVGAFFLQIQGSGQIRMRDGTVKRLGYAGQNGHPYYAIGRSLVARGALTKENVSLQTIRQWMQDNPQDAQALMEENRSYVFFKEIEGDGPLGAQNVALTSGRSLAIDPTYWQYGLPIFVQTKNPVPDYKADFSRLMIAQDTGGAIRGPIRGDVFFGAGQRAEYWAGHMKAQGQMWVFLPN